MADHWIVVDRKGLKKQLSSRHKKFILEELLRNSLDEDDVTTITIDFQHIGRNCCELVVTDDAPEGFRKLEDAFMMFGESYKVDHPEKAGRFDLGEKLVLAFCTRAQIETTKGTVKFILEKGKETRTTGTTKRKKGSCCSFHLEITKEEYTSIIAAADNILIPEGVIVTLNGLQLRPRKPMKVIEGVKLPTVIGHDHRPSVRKTDIHLHKVEEGEVAYLYELGIPIVATDDQFHVDIQQKVPTNWNRDNVTPAFLRKVRTAVYNETYQLVDSSEAATEAWVTEATSDKNCTKEAVEHMMDMRFTDKRVTADSSDQEATDRAPLEGYRVIHGPELNKDQWENVKGHGLSLPAGKVLPTPSVYDETGEPEDVVPPQDWTRMMQCAARHAKFLAKELMGATITVTMVRRPPSCDFRAWYGRGKLDISVGTLTFNLTHIKRGFFEAMSNGPTDDYHKLLIHEFGHDGGKRSHYGKPLNDALCDLGAKLARLCLDEPDKFSLSYFTRSFEGED